MAFYHFMRDLNHFYLSYASLWELDYDAEGFRWLDCHEEEKCVYAFERRSQRERLVAVFNFSDKAWVDFDLKVPGARELKPAFSSDLEPYGGSRRKQENAPGGRGSRLPDRTGGLLGTVFFW